MSKAHNIAKVGANQLLQFLGMCHKAKIASMVYGPPGIGKSEIHRQFADSIGYAIMEVRLSYYTDNFGALVWPDATRGVAIQLVPEVIAKVEALHKATKRPVLVFLDEITTATSDTLKTALEFVLDGTISGFRPACPYHVCAAGNTPDDTPEAIYLPATHRTRFFSVLFSPSRADTARYIRGKYKSEFAKAAATFLTSTQAGNVIPKEAPDDGIDCLWTPRSYARAIGAIDAMSQGMSASAAMTEEAQLLLKAAVGPRFSGELMSHLVLAASAIDADKVLKSPNRTALPTTTMDATATLNSVAEAVRAAKLDSKAVKAFQDYIGRMTPEHVGSWLSSAQLDHGDVLAAIASTISGKALLQQFGVVASSLDPSAAKQF